MQSAASRRRPAFGPPRTRGPCQGALCCFGDSGFGQAGSTLALEQLQRVPLDFILHTGDLAYGHGTPTPLETTSSTSSTAAEKLSLSIRCRGITLRNGTMPRPFLQAFVLPENGHPGQLERWSRSTRGAVHLSAGTQQIQSQQAAGSKLILDANERPWTVVFSHLPPPFIGQAGATAAFHELFFPILERFQVPLVLSGHDQDMSAPRC